MPIPSAPSALSRFFLALSSSASLRLRGEQSPTLLATRTPADPCQFPLPPVRSQGFALPFLPPRLCVSAVNKVPLSSQLARQPIHANSLCPLCALKVLPCPFFLRVSASPR